MRNIELIREVTNAAAGCWPDVLPMVGIDVPATSRAQVACPACGGKDRFRFDDNGRGSHFCNQCGAGDGLDLVQKVKQCDATEAARLVADVLGIDYRSPDATPKGASQGNASIEAERQQREQERQQTVVVEQERKRQQFTRRYTVLYNSASPGESAYLTARGLTGFTFPTLEDGRLLVALTDETGAVTAAQTITPAGEKRQVTDGTKRGAYHAVNAPEQPHTVIIAEGLATTLTTHLMRPDALTVAAIDAGNLIPVAEVMRRRYPEAQIIIAGDNDHHADGSANTGRIAAEKAAAAVSGWVSVPPTEHKADWDDYRQQNGLEAATRAFNDSQYQHKGKGVSVQLKAIEGGKGKSEAVASPALNQMGASQRGDVLLARYSGALAINGDSDTVHHYNGVIWRPIADIELHRELAAIYREAEISFSQPGIKSSVDTMKLSLARMGITERHLIGFNNGVFDTRAGVFRPHQMDDWLLIASGVEFSPAHEGETLASHAPNFWKWLTRSTGGNVRKADRVLAALYMVMANRYDWQLFLEVTGPGGSGKSVFAEICTMLAGKGNTVAASMSSLENPKERELIVGASLIVLSDMARYAGDGAGIKAITGGDKVAVDPKYKAPYSMRIPAVVLAVNNNSMTFSDRSGGISRRRVIFNFADVVPDGDRDIHLPEKIEAELAVIIRHLLTRFASQEEAKGLLLEQRQSAEALAVKREGDSLVDFCGYLMAMVECEGMFIGTASIIPFAPRRYLYHAYMAYMEAHGLGKPVSLTRFGKDMPGSMAEYSKEYKKERATRGPSKGNYQSNVLLKDDAGEWLPAATGGGDNMGNE